MNDCNVSLKRIVGEEAGLENQDLLDLCGEKRISAGGRERLSEDLAG